MSPEENWRSPNIGSMPILEINTFLGFDRKDTKKKNFECSEVLDASK